MDIYNDNNNNDVNEIFEAALKDPSLLSNINIEDLIGSIEDDKNNYLENKTTKMINEEIFNVIKKLDIPIEQKKTYCDKLIGYRYVYELHELHKGKHVRWIRESNNNLTNGGIIVDIKFGSNGTLVLCMNNQKKFIQYKFNECYTFQKMNETEQLIVMAYEYSQKMH